VHPSQDSQASLGIIGIKRNRTLVVSVLHHLTARSDQLIAARNPAIITNSSADGLGLKEGTAAYAIIKASDVMVGKDVGKVSARNVLDGTVAQVEDGAVDSVVTLKLSGGTTVVAVITNESVKSLGLKSGDSASAIIKASHVMVGVDH
jgi:molybdate transport system regulatory protein